MTQGFFQFNNSLIKELIDFTASSYDMFFLSGPKGSSKSEAIEKVTEDISQDNLIFKHFCFENSVIDDFLLNFYDGLKNLAIAGKLALKKFNTGDFKEKVSHYFKTLAQNCIIIVENFEKVEKNSEIIDFLSHLATFSNVKIIIVSRNENRSFHYLKMKEYKIESISKEDFKSKLTVLTRPIDEDLKEEFYDITQGLELYLNMSIKYCSNTNISIPDLMDEFRRRSDDFEHFIISKLISLIPSNYLEFFRILSCISHTTTTEFIENYNLGKLGYIDYLSRNFLINKFDKELYVKDYFKKYVQESLTLQEKFNYYKKLTDIYEKELAKSPKDRLLRLSRESIRKEIERFDLLIPNLNSKLQKNISYIGMSNFSFDEKTTLNEKFNKIKERKNKLNEKNSAIPAFKKFEDLKQNSHINKNKEENRTFIVDLINESRDLYRKYCYKDALDMLFKALDVDFDNEFRIELCTLIAKNYDVLNEFDNALKYYQEAFNYAKSTNDIRICEIEYFLAQLYKKQYKIDIAKEKYKSIVIRENYSIKYRSLASIELGEIEESQGNIEEASKNYENALSLSLGKDKKLSARSYYRLAILYDEALDYDKAIKYYKKNYTLSAEKSENEYYSISLTNLASIYTEQGKYREASEFLKLALAYDTENNDYENMYYSQKELAKLYTNIDAKNAIGYYKQALNSANRLNDNFKIALVYFEVGEFFYDQGEDELALNNFFNARKTLGANSKDENIIRINSRIQDIKLRLNSVNFNVIANKFGE